ncbi:hypothetical protein PPERSA_11594 [Pseudocohnilembus persalinus]|uniref:Uncharacterized protein n=1 Tax=Pseudocohnilembus persalinus TaxID=266149 RepID=A0A0V0Q9Z4_PSEPJ|nr:hypothetical protein PPERSA_11594 [Pseudocohnilembus persalinus]|eukprot:KRW98993.1 hypothetical protein PPERSA_11594 [Pseudocohnilembus persalinus]
MCKQKWEEKQYDDFLIEKKFATFYRLEKFQGIHKPIKHQCTQCLRIWKPSPKQCFSEDYFCPSCALHHRNNMERFKQERFCWTVNIPNTFYLYEITDPKNNLKYIKYGRTQHQLSENRYCKKEVKAYKMKQILNLRGPLKNITAIENFWKQTANQNQLRPQFSEKDFHGATECIIVNESLFKQMIQISYEIQNMDTLSYEDFTIQILKQDLQEKFNKLLKEWKAQFQNSQKILKNELLQTDFSSLI